LMRGIGCRQKGRAVRGNEIRDETGLVASWGGGRRRPLGSWCWAGLGWTADSDGSEKAKGLVRARMRVRVLFWRRGQGVQCTVSERRRTLYVV
jgi:hypothetical protein